MGSGVGTSVVVELFVVVVVVLEPRVSTAGPVEVTFVEFSVVVAVLVLGVLAAGPVEVTSVELSIGVVMEPGVSVVGGTGEV